MKPLAAILAASVLVLSTRSAAQGGGGVQSNAIRAQEMQIQMPRGAEFSAGMYPGEVLLPVYLLGAVSRPGIYNLPKKTELIRLLTLAGGISVTADSDHVTIKRRINADEKIMHINLSELVTEAKTSGLYLEAGDVVFIPTKVPLISPETSSILAFVATMLSLVTTALVLGSSLRK